MTKTTIHEEIYLVRRRVEVIETTGEEAPEAPAAPSLRPPAARRVPSRPGFHLLAGGGL
ncbi:MAG TPA: hypothetical protein VLC09_20090 [Polyangiaceae bacterium]|nr:hypothetical protein [Polyangiaceae bacterium]